MQLAAVPSQRYGLHDGAPALPAPMTLQVPTFPMRLQASQAPSQAVLQQTPSTQLPDEHWLFAEQMAPLAYFAVQERFWQKCVEMQFASAVHEVGQSFELPPQT